MGACGGCLAKKATNVKKAKEANFPGHMLKNHPDKNRRKNQSEEEQKVGEETGNEGLSPAKNDRVVATEDVDVQIVYPIPDRRLSKIVIGKDDVPKYVSGFGTQSFNRSMS